MQPLDVVPFSLPRCAPNEVRFEEPRDVVRVVVSFKKSPPRRLGLSYLQNHWPEVRLEQKDDLGQPSRFGWSPTDDAFNGRWQRAAISVASPRPLTRVITFKKLTEEFPETSDYAVSFRRTTGFRLDGLKDDSIRKIAVHTASQPARSTLRVELDAGRRTTGRLLQLEGYNAVVCRIHTMTGVRLTAGGLKLGKSKRREFEITVDHMNPPFRYANDDGHLRFVTAKEAFTISLASLEKEGPVWFREMGVFICRAEDPITASSYQEACRGRRTITRQVLSRDEQTFSSAFVGQPRPHAVAYSLGCTHARQKFWLEPCGDVVLHHSNVTRVSGKDTPRYKNARPEKGERYSGGGRFFFGLNEWTALSRHPDPSPVPVYHIQFRRGALRLEQTSCAVPLSTRIDAEAHAPDDPMVALLRFRFQNEGNEAATAELPIEYAPKSNRQANCTVSAIRSRSIFDSLAPSRGRILGRWKGRRVLRAGYETDMRASQRGGAVILSKRLRPGEGCEVTLKVPFVALDLPEETQRLARLSFSRCLNQVRQYWTKKCDHGARLRVPEEHCRALHAAHLAHVFITDSGMPNDPFLVNTSVGTSTYGNFSNESCMIVRDLDERGLKEEVRRRLAVWLKYQGTAPQPGNFTDFEGMYFGAGGFESGAYNQHHGWVLWALCEHYLMTRDRKWFRGVLDSVIAGADWVFRQRRNTMGPLPHSRGWERGFLPAGSLEDVRDFHYWLSTNVLTWRGCESCAQALEAIGHREAARIRRETDAYGRDLRRGFERMRTHAPLIRLRDGRWVPHYPSRLYCRGRDVGWIREVLEGSVYLLISGLYSTASREAKWILDDFQDTRYMNPPHGYVLDDPERNWFDRGGFSIQPNLLAGLLPHLDRDEPEVFIWMFFNAWCACYREEIEAMVEHPMPVLGFSNAAHFKTSDQANAMMWLRYMFAYVRGDTLHLGQAIPRQWFEGGEEMSLKGVCTRFGKVDVAYKPDNLRRRIEARVHMKLHTPPGRILVRFRNPLKTPLKAVFVNGKRHAPADARKGDVDITGEAGRVVIEARY